MTGPHRVLYLWLTLLGLPVVGIQFAEAAPSTQPVDSAPPPLPTFPATQPAAPSDQENATTVPTTLPLPPTVPSETQPASEPSPQTAPEAPATQPTASQPAVSPETAPPSQLHEVLVTADLDRAREQIAPSLGAVTYTIGPNQIASIPEGENTPFQQVLLRAPGVAEDSFGQVHVRGEHANLTYRVNGVLLPYGITSGIGGFGQELDTRIVQSLTLIDGSLPAQFGFHTAGIVDVTTKSGASLDHNELSLFGGSYDTFQPGLLFGGASGKLDYFVAASYKYSSLGIENPTGSDDPLHDYTDQERLFTYLGYRIDDTSRLMVLLNLSYATFQIPDRPNIKPAFMLAGHPNANSAIVNENQAQQDYYGVIAYQKSADKLSFQVAAFTRYGQIHFSPDPIGDLQFLGVAGNISNGFLTDGVQFDASYVLDDHNTVRFGLLGDYTGEQNDTGTTVFPVDSSGAQTSDVPFAINDSHGNWGSDFGIYLQDEWKMTNRLTLNYGARYDRFSSSFDNEGQLSPRVNLVWKIDDATTAHAGYSRYFQSPPVQYVWPFQINRFAGTSNAPATFRDDPTRAERSNYYDAGISRQITPAWQVTLDGYYKAAKPLLDSGQFGNALILSSFNYEEGKDYGPEISSTFKQGGLTLFGNFAYVTAEGRNFITNQYLVSPDDQAFARHNFIKLDHESEFTASAGISYTWKDNRVYVDALYGSGLRAGAHNDKKEPQYAPVSVGFEHTFHPHVSGLKDVRFRFDVVNVFDETYQLRNGTGIGVGAPQFGQRRTFLAGLTFDF